MDIAISIIKRHAVLIRWVVPEGSHHWAERTFRGEATTVMTGMPQSPRVAYNKSLGHFLHSGRDHLKHALQVQREHGC